MVEAVDPVARMRAAMEADTGDGGELWNPEVGDILIAYFLRYEMRYSKTMNTDVKVAVMREDETHKLWTVWLSREVLRSEFEGKNPLEGNLCGLKYHGRKKKPDGTDGYHRYTLDVDRTTGLTAPIAAAEPVVSATDDDLDDLPSSHGRRRTGRHPGTVPRLRRLGAARALHPDRRDALGVRRAADRQLVDAYRDVDRARARRAPRPTRALGQTRSPDTGRRRRTCRALAGKGRPRARAPDRRASARANADRRATGSAPAGLDYRERKTLVAMAVPPKTQKERAARMRALLHETPMP
jgi:hypothetical protein